MKVLAIYFVIYNHSQGFLLFTKYPTSTFMFWCGGFLSTFCKFAVPVFFAVSGALLLKNISEPLLVIFKKRILWKLITLVLISTLYYCVYFSNPIANWKSVMDFLGKVWSNKVHMVFWFMYAYLSFLISLPFLRLLAHSMNKVLYYYLFGLAIIFTGVIPVCQYLFFLEKYKFAYFDMTWVCNASIFVYPLLGYFLHSVYKSKSYKKDLILLWGLNILGIFITILMTLYKGHNIGAINERAFSTFRNSFVLFNCASMFLTAKYIFEKYSVPSLLEKLISSIASCSLGIYLFHYLILQSPFINNLLKLLQTCGINPLVTNLFISFITLLICYVITFILKKLSFSKIIG